MQAMDLPVDACTPHYAQRGRVVNPSPSSADGKKRFGDDDLQADLVEVALTEQPRRRAIAELVVQLPEPGACDLRAVNIGDRPSDLEHEPEPPLHRLARLADALRPAVDRAGLRCRAHVGAEPHAEDLGQCGTNSPKLQRTARTLTAS